MIKKLLKPPVRRGLFVHIAKTGGNSIAKSGIREKSSKFYCDWHGHMISTEIKKKIGNKNWYSMFKFSFVRNPYDRLISFYHFMVAPKPNWSILNSVLNNIQQAIGKRTFKEFCLMFSDNEIINKANGIQKQYTYLTNENGEIMVDYIGRFENFQQDWDYICENVFHHKYILPHENRSNHRKDYMSYYDEKTKQIVFNYYKKDFEMLRYNYS